MLKELLSNKSELSMMRALALICVACAVVIAIIGMLLDKDLAQVAMLVGAFLGPAFLGKATQAFAEKGE